VNGGTSTNNNNSTYRNDVAGGLVAFLNSNISATYGANIQYCTFSGEITSAGSTAGGIVGVVHTGKVYATVADCLNTANISAGINAGGIVGSNWDGSNTTAQKLYIRRSINTARISATNAGAILGYCGKAADLQVVNCFNNGAVANIYNYNTTAGQITTFKDTDNFNINETIDTAVSYLGAQKTELTGNSRSVRLVGKITATKADLSNYKAIGFVISATYAGGQVLTVEDTVVYSSMLLQGGDGELDSEYSTLTDGFYFAAVLKDLSAELGEVTFRVTPYYVDAEDTITYGNTGYNVVNIATGTVK
jgi:hypothetical protein